MSDDGEAKSQNEFNQQLTSELDGIVEDFRNAQITKVEALRKLTYALNDAERLRNISYSNNTLDPYIEQVEEHERSIRDAAVRGKRRRQENADGRRETREDDNSPNDDGRESEAPNSDEDGDEERVGKRPKLDTSKFPWKSVGFINSAILSKTHLQVIEDLRNFSQDIPAARQDLLNTPGCPPFPLSEWSNILKGRSVNLDTVFSEIFSVNVDEQEVVTISEGISLKVGKVKQSTKVNTHGDWTIAWGAFTDAMLFIFPYRRSELNVYQSHITGFFASQHTSVHNRVLNYDRAVRGFIGQQRSVLFDEVHKFVHLRYAHIDNTGAAVVREATSGPNTTPRGLRGRTRKTAEICRNYNAGRCQWSKDKCKYAHLCSNCNSSDHTRDKCPNKDKHTA
jgi:hypothetical protein